MGKFTILIVLSILFIIGVGLSLFYVDYYKGYDEACKDIGFEEWSSGWGGNKCVGSDGYINVYMECEKPFIMKDCIAIKEKLK